MNKDQIKGATKEAAGEIKEQVGKMTGDRETEARGHAKEAVKDTARDLEAEKLRQDELKRP